METRQTTLTKLMITLKSHFRDQMGMEEHMRQDFNKKNLSHIVALYAAVTLSFVSSTGCVMAQQPLADVEKSAAESYRKFKATSDFGDLNSIVKKWAETLSSSEKTALIRKLAFGLYSKEPLSVTDYGSVTIQSRVESGKMSKVKDGPVFKQDIFIEGGRCAWALEYLTGGELPTISESSSEKDIRAAGYEIWFRIQEASIPKEERMDLTKLAPEERLKLAKSEDTHVVVLAKLAKDKEFAVRKAVASNFKTSVHTLRSLADSDSEPDVRSAAVENLKRARTIKNLPK
jgi:hypothetical protein